MNVRGDSMSPGFNSRTREGCDAPGNGKHHGQLRFNSRTREGCDWVEDSTALGEVVSIHAPGRGATDNNAR